MFLNKTFRGRLLYKYVVYFVALVSIVLLASGSTGLYFAYDENRSALLELQREKALGAASKIELYVNEIEHQIGWTHLPSSAQELSPDHFRYEYLKLLRQVPAITEARRIDSNGKETLRVSRLSLDVLGSNADLSDDPVFVNTRHGAIYFGPVYFRKDTEPYMTIAVPGGQDRMAVTAVEVNLKFVWDVITRMTVGDAGYAFIVDSRGQLVSHPDIGLVLRKTDFSSLSQVRELMEAGDVSNPPTNTVTTADNWKGVPVLTAFAPIPSLGWTVFVEQPESKAFAPLNALVNRTAVLLLFGLVLAIAASLILARRMVSPIRALESGASEIGSGALDHRINIQTGDELEALAERFNEMSVRLQESYASLERKVEERTHELEIANQTKSRFLAAASHDLRQPMHALGLFVAQLGDKVSSPDTLKIVDQAQASVEALGELFDALLDISKLDAGTLAPQVQDFPVADLLSRMRNDFYAAAAEERVHLRVVPSSLVVRSDPVLLERVLINLVSNAIRYTQRGGRVLLGCRRHEGKVRIEVWDSGEGIPDDKQAEVFQEFFQLSNPERDRSKGLGLGLAIVQRIAALLGHRIDLRSTPGKGSMFAVELPMGKALRGLQKPDAPKQVDDRLVGALVLVVDDDTLVQQGMRGLLTGWGCHVINAGTAAEAVAEIDGAERLPDVCICDYRLPDGNGIQVVERLHVCASEVIPAVLISGDTAPEVLNEARKVGYPLLHKPVRPAKLRALLSQLLTGNVRSRVQQFDFRESCH